MNRTLASLATAAVLLTSLKLYAQTMPEPNKETHQVNVVLPAPMPATPENIAKLKLPAGFHIAKFAEGLASPRVIVISPAGNIYVSSRDAGTITMLSPDGAMKKQVVALEDVHGMVIHNGTLYYVTINEVYSAPINADGSLGASKLIIRNLPDAGQHVDRTLAVGPDNLLYVSVGSTCNTCQEHNRVNSTMQRFHLDGSGQETFATGLRNTIGFNFQPGTGALYGWDDGVDWQGDKVQREELNKIEMGKEYGWPYILGDGERNLYLTPPHGVTLDQWDAKTTRPVLTWAAHASGMQLIFLNGAGLPADYNGDALASMHGSWGANPPSGYEVVRIHFEGGAAKTITPFVEGFLQSVKCGSGWARFARPFGLAQMQDGSVLLGDEQNGILYRVTYGK
jgi:glucose/arabinose dehydrogenase